jgi:hypothetical protein
MKMKSDGNVVIFYLDNGRLFVARKRRRKLKICFLKCNKIPHKERKITWLKTWIVGN